MFHLYIACALNGWPAGTLTVTLTLSLNFTLTLNLTSFAMTG